MRRGARLRGVVAALVAVVVAVVPATSHAFRAQRSPGTRLTMNLNVGTSPFDTLARLSHFSNTELHFCVLKCPGPT